MRRLKKYIFYTFFDQGESPFDSQYCLSITNHYTTTAVIFDEQLITSNFLHQTKPE